MTGVGTVSTEPVEGSAASRLRVRVWPLLVTFSFVLVVGGTAAFAVLWLLSGETKTTSYVLRGSFNGVQIRVVSGNVEVLGGAQGGVAVRRTARSTFGHGPIEWRHLVGRRLELESTCPRLVVGACAANYRVAVPDDVPVSVRADHGTISVEGFRGSASLTTGAGGIFVDRFCGYTLHATAVRGDVSVVTACSPELLVARSTSGNVSATLPAGRYRIDASSGGGPAIVRGLTPDPDAPWEIEAHSTSGDVAVEAP
ncbi:MAG TPA: DUF4097 family beta strand repeat-containing protein [Gaiellaceae bacterium]